MSIIYTVKWSGHPAVTSTRLFSIKNICLQKGNHLSLTLRCSLIILGRGLAGSQAVKLPTSSFHIREVDSPAGNCPGSLYTVTVHPGLKGYSFALSIAFIQTAEILREHQVWCSANVICCSFNPGHRVLKHS